MMNDTKIKARQRGEGGRVDDHYVLINVIGVRS